MQLSDGEKLILLMLADLQKALKLKGEIDAEFISKAIIYGHTWALDWRYRGTLLGEDRGTAPVKQTVDILDMWSFLEVGFRKLTDAERADLEQAEPYYGKDIRFPGFDANDDQGHYSVAMFLIDDMGRWQEFRGRDLNSHSPTVSGYLRMLEVFLPMRPSLGVRGLSLDQIKEILAARGP